jgi:hypothetical protein
LLVPNRTTEQGTKELPLTVSVNVGEPAGTEVGVPTGGTKKNKLCEIELMLGEGRLVVGVVMVKDRLFDVPEAFDTETFALPGNATSWGKIEAVSWPEFTKAVGVRGEPFQFTTDPLSKFEPVTVSVNPAELQ